MKHGNESRIDASLSDARRNRARARHVKSAQSFAGVSRTDAERGNALACQNAHILPSLSLSLYLFAACLSRSALARNPIRRKLDIPSLARALS